MKWLTGRANDTDGATGQQHRNGRGVAVNFFGDDAAEFGAFSGRSPHQRDLRIVLIKSAGGKLGGHAGPFAKINHIETTRRDDCGNFSAGSSIESFWSSRQDSADEFIGPFGGGEVEHARNQPAGDESFHRATTVAGSSKDEDLIAGGFHDALGFGDASGRVAKHTGDNKWFFAGGYRGGLAGNRGVDHAADCGRGVGKNYA